MSISNEVLLLLCGIGAVQSYFLSIYILTQRNPKNSGIFLGLLFLALALRVSKSVLWAFWDETPLWLLNLGFAAHAAIGPFLLLYVLTELKIINPKRLIHYLHLVPALILVFGGFTLEEFWYRGGYGVLLYQSLTYVILSIGFFFYIQGKRQTISIDFTWIITLSFGVFILNFAYFSNYILGLTSYMLGPLIYSVIIYGLSFYGLKQHRLFMAEQHKKKYKNINLSKEDSDRYLSKVYALMDAKPYLENEFNLNTLSGSTKIPKHILSHLFNERLNQSFPDFINGYRVNEAKIRLTDPGYEHQTIASVAYDCGFNSLSSFNTAFKKFESRTPSEFKLSVTA